jgi:Fe2+ or Zn2+ uptake regulation protein
MSISEEEPNNSGSSRPAKSMRQVLAALQQLNHATAPEVMDWVNTGIQRSTSGGKKLSLTSVYRALNQLVAQGEIKPLNFNDGQVRYELNSHHHHHHLVCTQCDSVQVLDQCPVEPMLAQVENRFRISYHNFEIFGLCQECFA